MPSQRVTLVKWRCRLSKRDNTPLIVLGWLFLAPCVAVVLAAMLVWAQPEPVKQTEPAKERRVVTIIKWLWEKD
jgi:phosphate/sulfate permease